MRLALAATLLFVATLAAAADVPYEFAVDVPSTFAGPVPCAPNQVARHSSGFYEVVVTLPSQVTVSALHQLPDGSLLFTPRQPTILDGTQYSRRDIVEYDGASFSLYFDGASSEIPSSAGIDALYVDATGAIVVSFDAPVMLAGAWRSRSSLLRYDGSWTQLWDAGSAGVPPGANVVGADVTPTGDEVVTFDIPVRLGSTQFLPGDLARWSGTSFELLVSDPSWPRASQLRDFSFLPGSGAVPETSSGSQPLRIDKTGEADLVLSWDASCATSDSDYAVYEGVLGGTFDSHSPTVCTTGGNTTASVIPGGGDRYFLVVPHNALAEGSYGLKGDGTQRATALGACQPQSLAVCGPAVSTDASGGEP